MFSTTKGDMKSVITAILTDTEARAGTRRKRNPESGKLRSPARTQSCSLLALVRGLNGTATASNSLDGRLRTKWVRICSIRLTVFSYFSPQNRVASGLLAPTFKSTRREPRLTAQIPLLLHSTARLIRTVDAEPGPFIPTSRQCGGLLEYISYAFLHSGMSTSLSTRRC